MSKHPTLYLIRGLPGSGKTTMARGLHAGRAVEAHHEADHFFDELGKFAPELLRSAHQQCLTRTLRDLGEGLSVVVANTFTQRWEIQPYIKAAHYLGIDYEILIATGNYRSVNNVSDEVIARMRKRWEDDVDVSK